MSENRFCPNCGQKVDAGEKFCANCGYQLSEDVEKVEENKSLESSNPTEVSQSTGQFSRPNNNNYNRPKKPINKKVMIPVVVLVALIGAYIAGNKYYSSQNQLNRFTTALSKSDSDVSGYLTTTEGSKKVPKEEAKAFKKQFSGSQSSIYYMKQSLMSNGSYGNYSWVQSGRRLFVFPAYKLQADPGYAYVSTNNKNVKIYQDGNKIATTKDDSRTVKVGPIYPGKYTFKAQGTVNGEKLSSKKDFYVKSGKDNNVELNLSTATFTVKGMKDSNIYINDKKVGKLDSDGEKKFTNYPITNGLKLYLTTDVNGKEIKSKQVSVEDKINQGVHTITPGYKGLVSKDEAESLLSSVFSGLRYGASSSTADHFIDGENNDSYNELVDFFKTIEDHLEDVDVVKINSITPLGNNKAEVSYSVKYSFENDDQRKVQQFTCNGAQIEKEDGEYKVKSIGKTGSSPDWERRYDD